jgi:type IV secretion system protein VirD4
MFWKSKPRGRIVERIKSEADLAAFRNSDPYMLPSTLHGDARYAWVQHLWRAGMFATFTEWNELQCGYPLATFGGHDGRGLQVNGMVCWRHEGHRLIVGAPGSGKFTCALAPLLLNDDDCNAFIIDPKGGEAFRHTACFRDELVGDDDNMGARVIDPCGLFPHFRGESINPLDTLHVENPQLVGDADKLADALVPISGHETEPVWPMFAKKVLRDLMIHVATYPSSAIKGQTATLMDVQRIISDGIDETILEEMAQNPVADGAVARGAVEISGLKASEKTWIGVKFQIDANLAFLDNPGVRKTLSETTFDVRDLRRERVSLYVAVPNKEKDALSRWLRLIYTTVIDRIDDVPGRDVHVVVDEFSALGKFTRVLTDLATQRSAGMRYHLVVQDLNQLNETYGSGWQTIVGNCAIRQFLGVNDNFTAEYVSKALGQTTLTDGEDFQHAFPDSPPTKRTRFVGRDLMTPAEVVGLASDQMLLFADRCPRPLRIWKTHYFATAPWSERAIDVLVPTLAMEPA